MLSSLGFSNRCFELQLSELQALKVIEILWEPATGICEFWLFVIIILFCLNNVKWIINKFHHHFFKSEKEKSLTCDGECQVAAAADVAGCIFGTAEINPAVIRTGALDGKSPVLVVGLMAALHQLHSIFEPLAGRPGRKGRRPGLRMERVVNKHTLIYFRDLL